MNGIHMYKKWHYVAVWDESWRKLISIDLIHSNAIFDSWQELIII